MTRSTMLPSPAAPADGLVAVVPLAALAVWLLNDHVLKAAVPGPLTGKLSDIAGLIVAPLALVAAWEVGQWATGRWSGPSRLALVLAIATVGIGFAAVETWSPAADAYRWGLGLAQSPFRALAGPVGAGPSLAVVPVAATADLTDLLALPALAVTWWAGQRRTAPSR